MCGVGNLTRAAYANQRMTLSEKSAKFQLKGGIRWSRYVEQSAWRVSSFMFFNGRLPMPSEDVKK